MDVASDYRNAVCLLALKFRVTLLTLTYGFNPHDNHILIHDRFEFWKCECHLELLSFFALDFLQCCENAQHKLTCVSLNNMAQKDITAEVAM